MARSINVRSRCRPSEVSTDSASRAWWGIRPPTSWNVRPGRWPLRAKGERPVVHHRLRCVPQHGAFDVLEDFRPTIQLDVMAIHIDNKIIREVVGFAVTLRVSENFAAVRMNRDLLDGSGRGARFSVRDLYIHRSFFRSFRSDFGDLAESLPLLPFAKTWLHPRDVRKPNRSIKGIQVLRAKQSDCGNDGVGRRHGRLRRLSFFTRLFYQSSIETDRHTQ